METTATATAEIKQLTVIDKALQENNLTEKILSDLETESKAIVIKGVEDKDGYKKADAFRKKAKAVKVLAKKICFEGREEANRIAKEWIAAEKKVVDRAEGVEKETEAKIDAITAEIERLAEEKRKAEQERIQKRTKALIDGGCTYDGVNYTIAGISISDAQIKAIKDDDFNIIISNVKVEHQKELEAKAEADRLKKLEEERLENVRKETERIQAENQRIAEENKRKAEELTQREEAIKKKERDEIINSRIAKCVSLGLKWSGADESYVLHDVNVSLIEIKVTEDKEWGELVAKLEKVIPERIKEYNEWQSKLAKEKEDKRLKDIEDAKIEAVRKARFDSLKAIDYIYPLDDLGTMSDASWNELFEAHNKSFQAKKQEEFVAKLKKEAEDKKIEDARLAALATDKEKLLLFSDTIGDILIPEVQSQEAKVVVLEIKTMISKMQEHVAKKVKNL